MEKNLLCSVAEIIQVQAKAASQQQLCLLFLLSLTVSRFLSPTKTQTTQFQHRNIFIGVTKPSWLKIHK